MEQFFATFDPRMLSIVFMLFLGDILFGVVRAIKDGNFQLSKVGDGLTQKTLPFGLVLIFGKGMQIAAEGSAWADYVTISYNIVWGVVGVTLVGSIKNNIEKIMGVSLPAFSITKQPVVEEPEAEDPSTDIYNDLDPKTPYSIKTGGMGSPFKP